MVLEWSTIVGYTLAVLIVTVPAIWILYSYGPRHETSREKFFEKLKKPDYTPSKGLFSFLWIVTYATMGVAAYTILDQIHVDRSTALTALVIFAAKYILGVSLIPIFFGRQDLILTGFMISALIPMIFWAMVEFYKVSTTAFLLLLPYASWIGFLTVLSFDFIKLNHRFISNHKIPKKSGSVLPQVLQNNQP